MPGTHYQDANLGCIIKCALCTLMVMGIKHCGSTKFCSIVFLQLCRYRDGRAVRLDAGPDGIQLLPRVHEAVRPCVPRCKWSGVRSLDIFVSASRALRERQRGPLECADAQASAECVQRRQSAPRFALPSSFEETPISLGTSVAFAKLKLLLETDRALPGLAHRERAARQHRRTRPILNCTKSKRVCATTRLKSLIVQRFTFISSLKTPACLKLA